MGQYVDISMFDGMISAMCSNYASFLGDTTSVPGTMGTRYPTVVPYGVYNAQDRALAIAVGSEKLWAAFRHGLGLPLEARFESNALRIENRVELDVILNAAFARKTAAEWIAILRADGIPCSLVLNFAEVLAHPECDEAILQLAHYVGSTTGIIEAAARSKASTLIIATEDGVFHQIAKRVPDKKLLQAFIHQAGRAGGGDSVRALKFGGVGRILCGPDFQPSGASIP